MKKIFLFLFLITSTIGVTQNSGITYQAVIYGPNGQQLPGANNQQYILANKTICLQFSIIDHQGVVEYQETIVTTTDKFGMVNLLIGTGNQVGGYATGFNGIVWNVNTKSLKVELDASQNCQNFTQISNNPFTYVPFAYFSANGGEPGPAGPQGPAGTNGTNGLDGLSAYQIWLNSGNTGTEADFIASLQGVQGPAGTNGTNGTDGLSAYQIWINNGNSGTETDFIASLQGAQGPAGATGATGPAGVTGPQGPAGSNGIDGVNGTNGTDGLSAYQIWLNLGNVGTEADFITSLTGPQGTQGAQGPAGANGSDGATGPQGPIGLTGPQGPAGANGNNGIDGLSAYQIWINNGNTGTEIEFIASLQGAQGPQGIQGPAGANGSDGATGPQGPAGANGNNGADGKNALVNTTLEPAGANCATGGTKIEVGIDINENGVLDVNEINISQTKYVCNGAQGPQGIEGPAGVNGIDGATGPQGEQGPIGLTGETGPQGIQGIQGPAGINGLNGTDGLSAYQIWLNNGNTGTEADFISSLQGAQGPQGIQGPAGATGPQGPQGIQGEQGPIGLTGPQGPAGANGNNGIDGLSAYQIWINNGNSGTEAEFIASLQGAQGPQGIQGPAGANGSDGATGPQGVAGPQGSQGIQGEQGPIGLTGAQGPAGTNGTNGIDGLSAYQIWLNSGNTGTESDFIASLQGAQGPAGTNGQDGKNTLVKTTSEPAGTNCANGGTKIEVGLDANSNGILDSGEINNSLTKYICNGENLSSSNASGFNNFSNIFLLNNQTTYTVPIGKSARISQILANSSILSGDRVISINGTAIYIGSTFEGTINQTDDRIMWTYFLINGDFWLPEGTTISIVSTNNIGFLSIQEIENNNLNCRIVTSLLTVPNGKKWKISSVFPNSSLSGNKDFVIKVNGSSIYIGAAKSGAYYNRGASGNIYDLLKNEIWLPQGTTIEPDTNIYGISVIEY
ncbi:hypothetical protein [uncultured Flavobacterium sp.]|uniref:DUF7151 family protein n=1 Tax=uncultured Flavobacterium sp. TaxID=165435 RepID=UPI00260F0ACA|nr:hypothetical protein [uncultured Flavobacterium sp.]